MDRNQVEQKLRALAQHREKTEAQLQQSEQRLAELESEESSLRGELNLGRRALGDLDAHHEKLQEELRQVERDEARAALEDAVKARAAASDEAAKAARGLRVSLEGLAASRAALEGALAELKKLEPRAEHTVERETTSFDDEWHSLAPLLEQELDVRVQMQVVEVAAESSNPRELLSLPQHLQVLARARRKELNRQAQEDRRVAAKHRWR